MRKIGLALILAAGLAVSAACTAPEPAPAPTPAEPTSALAEPTPTPAASPTDFTLVKCRIVDGAEEGKLLLAGMEDNQVYLLDVAGMAVVMDGGSSGASELKDGMLVEVGNRGMILESFPAQFANATSIAGNSGSVNNLCGLYLQVLNELWDVDSGLNDGITKLGLDFSKLEGLTGSEKAALGYAFGQAHGMTPVTGTWAELRDQGYFTEVDLGGDAPADRKLYEWKDGILFSIEGNTEAFTADKWRGPLAAFVFYDCFATEKDGVWTYEVGSEMIS